MSFNTTYLDYREEMQSNYASVVVGVKLGGTQILIPGDLEAGGVDELINLGKMPQKESQAVRILVAPHHGSETAVIKPT